MISIIYLIITFCNVISIYNFRKKHNFKNSIVIDKNGEHVTSKFNIEVDGQKLTITAKDLTDSTFYNNTYTCP